MEVSGFAALATEMSQTRTAGTVQVAVLRTSLDIREANAMQLLEAASQVIPSSPPHLGKRIDTSA